MNSPWQAPEIDLSSIDSSTTHLLGNCPLPLGIYDIATLDVLFVNKAIATQLGYTVDEMLSLRITDILPPTYHPTLQQKIAEGEAAVGYFHLGERQLLCKDGSHTSIDAYSHHVAFDGRAARMVLMLPIFTHEPTVSLDVRIQINGDEVSHSSHGDETLVDTLLAENDKLHKRIEELKIAYRTLSRATANAILAKESHYLELANRVSDIFFLLDKQNRVSYCNKAVYQHTGLSVKEVIGKTVLEIFPHARIAEKLAKHIGQRNQPVSFPLTYENKTLKQQHYFHVTVFPEDEGLAVLMKLQLSLHDKPSN